ncbi:cAMP-dependent protein kinase regulatory subunit [Plasmodium sp. gorilla clade G2]|uniref:cAMP-dependent protein kinase regulatory subunit n=1 Tax=Plasmodium sp. gorilla clade G2 TaxID=880535 RepID=UPI000D207D4E|nr:cAMP-dependent protein kinase regulatory subunit [Plasmodium sp. gorilla clade G2]SOV16879.1 cAMP-dependent protein kinase regulatory subunit [Plasmodium sp. gorilla clade G2]
MGNVCTWRQGKEKAGEDNSQVIKDKELQNEFKTFEQKMRNNKKNAHEGDMNNDGEDDRYKFSRGFSLSKKPGKTKITITKTDSEILDGLDYSEMSKQVLMTLNKKNILNEDASSDGNDTDCHTMFDRKEIERKVLDLESIHFIQKKRLSVSAEAYGDWNKKIDNFIPKVYKKDEKEKAKIREALNESFLFNHLNKKEFEIIVNAFFDKNVEKGVNIINEGDYGDLLYVIDQGEVEIYKTKENNKKEVLTVLKSKDVFGELALLYNSRRAASATALTKCHLWALDRESFTYIIKDMVAKKRKMYEDILSHVNILKDMDPYERCKVADCLKSKSYNDGEIIIKEGEEGDTFFILIDGNAVASKDNKVIKTYAKGDYFGELALLKNKPRAATIKAQNFCQVVYLDRKSFKRLLGPIEDILHRNVENYKQVLNELGLDTTCIDEN